MNQQLEATIKKSVNEALVRLAPDLQVSKPGHTYTMHCRFFDRTASENQWHVVYLAHLVTWTCLLILSCNPLRFLILSSFVSCFAINSAA
jgi:hypothetical protein